ncbi:hypothetical protein GCK72_016024 [Caenorhabditis remanei]|uniref:G-protein coupled receptors family 1 profile domain-containing protein n=1 Tax=Caenorhabditis remanei TaxID=31234 RepID=A0A6A5GWK3_CAERE|nr:hypothetical protein GCK72_016024 [Caenorhabditis remanei]KAF1759557.1 hypothetical protein GCK72_016024 [Caenorhabditis remanei]
MTVFNDMQKEYPNRALIILGVSIGLTTVLDITGVFTNCWISDGQNCTGIVPFDSSGPVWLAATSWMMFISVGVAVVMIALYFVIVIEVLKLGYHITIRKRLIFIRLLAVLYLFLIVISILVFLPNVGSYKNSEMWNQAGWSCWLTIISIVGIGLVELFGQLVQRQCIAT